jgi:hypothetical protein
MKPIRRICALDLGVMTGWCMGDLEGWESGTQHFELARGESPGMRYYRFRRWLEEETADCDFYIYEQVVHRPGSLARELAANFAGRVQEVAARRQVDHTSVYPPTLKKYWTRGGRAKKDAMMAAVIQRTGRTVATDHEADAVAAFYYAWDVVRGRPLKEAP